MSVVHVHSEKVLKQYLGQKDKTVFIKFTASWCGPCKAIQPAYVQISSTCPNADFLVVDIEELEEVAMKFNVSSMPTFIAVKNAQILQSVKGANKIALQNMVNACA